MKNGEEKDSGMWRLSEQQQGKDFPPPVLERKW